MNGKKSKEITKLAQQIHLTSLSEGKMAMPETEEEALSQLRWIQRKLKKNYNALPASKRS